MLTEVTEGGKADAAALHGWLQSSASEIKVLSRKEKIGGDEHKADWAKLSSRRTAAFHEPDLLFNIRELPKLFLYFAGDFFGGQSGAQSIEGGFSQWDHLTDSAQDTLLKEALMMHKYLNDRRSENKSGLLRQRADSDATMDTPLPNVNGSRQQVAVAHGAELLDEFARYEELDADPLSAQMAKGAKAEKAAAKQQRTSEHEAKRAAQIEARKRGRTPLVFNRCYAAARNERRRRTPSGQLSPRTSWADPGEGAVYQAAKKARAELAPAASRGRGRYRRPTPCPSTRGTLPGSRGRARACSCDLWVGVGGVEASWGLAQGRKPRFGVRS